MLRHLGVLFFLWSAAFPSLAAEAPLICFGNEPSWSLTFAEPGVARLALPDEPAVDYRGSATRLDALKERAWRGKAGQGAGGELVAFLRESSCSDGMSETKHPQSARVSLPDGRFLAGCCRVPSAPAARAAPAPTIEGPTWRLTGLPGKDAKALARTGRPVTIRFNAGRVEGFSGCNQIVGAYTLEGDRIKLDPLAGTMMACEPAAMAIESAVTGALAGTLRHAISADRLSLTPAAGGAALTFKAEPAPVLAGPTWHVTGYNNGRQAVVSPLLGTALTLRFADGAVQGFAGCNTFRASYTSEGDRLAIGPVATTRKSCSGEGVMQQEREFLAALATATTWALPGGKLDVHRADGERVLTASRSAK